MKLRTIIFGLLAIFVLNITMSELNAQEKKKYYIVFDNFEEDYTIEYEDGSSKQLVEHLYYTRLSNDPNLGPYSQLASFGPATFAARPITEYDCAIFPLGDEGLQASYGGIKILDKVKEMLDAGKGVILIGRSYMSQANYDGASRTFLKNEVNIDYNRYLTSSTSGGTTTYERFDLNAIEEDPVGQGVTKVCNTKYQENNDELAPPFMWYVDADFFKIPTTSRANGFDVVHPSEGDLFGGGRWISDKGGRLVFWSVGFDVATKIHDTKFGTNLINGVNWTIERMLRPEQWIEAEINKLNFENVEPGDYKVDELRIRNFGKEDLTITETYIEAAFSDEGIYKIAQGEISPDNPKVLGPNEFMTIKIMFSPDAEEVFDDAIIIKSDALNTGSLTVRLTGQGGEQVEIGPRVSKYEFPVDFGEIAVGKVVNKDVEITNTGTGTLVVWTLDTTLNEGGAFLYHKAIKTPIQIPAGESYPIPMRFFPLHPDREYKAQIRITCNANNVDENNAMFIDLIGKTLSDKSGPEASCETEQITWGQVVDYEDYTFQVHSNGDMNLFISDIYVDGNNEMQDVFRIMSETQASIPPGESYDVTIRFQPVKSQKYSSELVIRSNAKVNDVFYIPLFGTGDVSVNDDGEAGFEGIFNMKLNTNPVSDMSELVYIIESNDIKELNLMVVDASGRVINRLSQGSKAPGRHAISINANSYSSGSYYILAEIDGMRTMLPMIIAR